MPQEIQKNLIWLDMEMTGLLPDKDRIIELGVVVTDMHLEVIDSRCWAIFQPKSILDKMDEWNQSTHTRSGLLERLEKSHYNESLVEQACLSFLSQLTEQKSSPMCGNSICQDRRFMARYMPTLEDWFHYRNLDVSTLKELSRRWAPQVASGFKKSCRHEALSDVFDSINELKYYRDSFLKIPLDQ